MIQVVSYDMIRFWKTNTQDSFIILYISFWCLWNRTYQNQTNTVSFINLQANGLNNHSVKVSNWIADKAYWRKKQDPYGARTTIVVLYIFCELFQKLWKIIKITTRIKIMTNKINASNIYLMLVALPLIFVFLSSLFFYITPSLKNRRQTVLTQNKYTNNPYSPSSFTFSVLSLAVKRFIKIFNSWWTHLHLSALKCVDSISILWNFPSCTYHSPYSFWQLYAQFFSFFFSYFFFSFSLSNFLLPWLVFFPLRGHHQWNTKRPFSRKNIFYKWLVKKLPTHNSYPPKVLFSFLLLASGLLCEEFAHELPPFMLSSLL